jgi:hypothetical protein
VLERKERRWLTGKSRQFVHVVVDGFELPVPGIEQHVIEPAVFALAGEE